MPLSPTLENRLMALEIKASFAEDLLDKFDQIVIRQQDQIDRLTREVLALRQRAPADDLPTSRNLRDDLPPHY